MSVLFRWHYGAANNSSSSCSNILLSHLKCIMEVKNWGKIEEGDLNSHQNVNDCFLGGQAIPLQKFHQNLLTF